MNLRDVLTGRDRPTPDPSLRGIFTPRGAETRAQRGPVLATWNGIGRSHKFQQGGLDVLERLRLISPEARAAAAGGGPVRQAATGAVQAAPAADFVGESAAGAAIAGRAAVSDNPIYGGM